MRIRCGWIALIVVACVAASGPDTAGAAPQAGGFRGKGPADAAFEARSLEQEDAPVTVAVAGVGRDERGVTISLTLTNPGDAAVTRHVVGVWVLSPDATVRGVQELKQPKALAAGESRTVDVVLRLIPVQAGDILVAAVQEAVAGTAWRREKKELEADIKRVVRP